jgi:hypothetical protein
MCLRCSSCRMVNRWWYCVSPHRVFRVVYPLHWGDDYHLLLPNGRAHPCHLKQWNNRALPIRAGWQH